MPADGKLKTVAIAQLLRHCGLQGQNWIRPVAFGLPIAGELPQRFAYKRDGDMFPCYLAPAYTNRIRQDTWRAQLSLAMRMPSSCGAKLSRKCRRAGCALLSHLAPPANQGILIRRGITSPSVLEDNKAPSCGLAMTSITAFRTAAAGIRRQSSWCHGATSLSFPASWQGRMMNGTFSKLTMTLLINSCPSLLPTNKQLCGSPKPGIGILVRIRR